MNYEELYTEFLNKTVKEWQNSTVDDMQVDPSGRYYPHRAHKFTALKQEAQFRLADIKKEKEKEESK